jgi:hypothetical protein
VLSFDHASAFPAFTPMTANLTLFSADPDAVKTKSAASSLKLLALAPTVQTID